MANAVAKTDDKSRALATTDDAALLALIAEESTGEAGGVSMNASDGTVPYIVVLADNSPQVKKRDPEYVDGAEVGMLLNTSTKQLYAMDAKQAEELKLPQLYFQPCSFDHCVVEWIPRTEGGGFVARHPLVDDNVDKTLVALGGRQVPDPQDPNKKLWKTADGTHDLIDTRYYFGHVITVDNDIEAAVIAFSSTGHQTAREWMTLIKNFKVNKGGVRVIADSWMKKYLIGTKPKKNKKGDWFVASVADAGIIADPFIRAQGKKLYESFRAGLVRAGTDQTSESNEDNSGI